ncbi:putative cucumisin [Lupinus albus]|uniref:Putative cucumisin n=1 Tax=Lupinus albus TaxID=3870 RepID=A0A6A4NA37_LUPAL|nr:putative cucumisin [Lupinus albus]
MINRKLIGARYFYEGYKTYRNKTMSYNSARDYDGHGTHTLSTAAGNFVSGVSVFGNGNGTASGASPNARVVSYKAIWEDFGYDADILAAFEAAIADGVDVLSISVGGQRLTDYWENTLSIGSFHAFLNGLVVVNSAGNDGPTPYTVINTAPWVITVGASTTDREFTNNVTLGDNTTLQGVSISMFGLSSHELYPLINASDAKADNASSKYAYLCDKTDIDPKKIRGKILICFADTGDQKWVEQTEAVGVISLVDESFTHIHPATLMLPAAKLNYTNSKYLLNYINQTKSPMATISKAETKLDIKSPLRMGAFSSRGPNPIEPRILKPDVTAPGVNIIAANTEKETIPGSTNKNRNTPFKMISGTSMSCPHVAGLVVLLKALHPDWSSAAIKSAIITTATPLDNSGRPILEDNTQEEATPFSYGAGHIQPNLAADPGLVYDLMTNDYLNFLCAHGYSSSTIGSLYRGFYVCPKHFKLANFNYPSITIINLDLGHSIKVTRTLTNVGSPSTYSVHIKVPDEVIVSVEPRILMFHQKGDKKDFRVTLSLKPQINNKASYFFGSLVWTDGKHNVRSPITVKNSRH